MTPQDIDVRRTTSAEPPAVWRLLDDSRSWPDWTPIESAEVIEPAGADGLGEVRSFTTGRVTVTERIVERRPPNRLTYRLLSGLAVRDYRAEIDVTSRASGSEIRWHTTFRAKVPGSGWLYRRALLKATQQFVDGLASKAAQR